MTARTEAWKHSQGWTTPAEVSERSGLQKPTLTRTMRAMATEGLLEHRFTDGVGDEYRRIETAEPPKDFYSARRRIQALLADGPRTVRELCDALDLGPTTIQSALKRMEGAGEASRIPDTQPMQWRLL